MSKVVPIMFHSVGLRHHSWCYPWISEPIALFEDKMAALSRKGYKTVFFKDILREEEKGTDAVALTFDDGYLDNWVHVFPVLRKHGFRATIFINPEFVDGHSGLRPQVDPRSLNDGAHVAQGCCAGFLCWDEIREMERSGLVDIQSHALTHTWYFKGPRVVDFWHPGAATESNGPIWMLWNAYPECKPRYLTEAGDYESRIAYGTPIYEHGKSLATRRYFPEPPLGNALVDHVNQNKSGTFFQRPAWREELHAIVAEHDSSRKPQSGEGRFETAEEYLARVRFELSESKRILEHQLGKAVEALCWPGGGVTNDVLAIARDVGYRRFTLPSAWKAAQAAGRYTDLNGRMASTDRMRYRGRDLGPCTAREFIWSIRRWKGSWLYRWVTRWNNLLRLLLSFVR